jgi:hypothetical protein
MPNSVAYAQDNILPSGSFGPPLPSRGTPSKPTAHLGFKTPKFFPLEEQQAAVQPAQRLNVYASLSNFAEPAMRGSSSSASTLALSFAAMLSVVVAALF